MVTGRIGVVAPTYKVEVYIGSKPQSGTTCQNAYSGIVRPSSPSISRIRSHCCLSDAVVCECSDPWFSMLTIPSRSVSRLLVICDSCEVGRGAPGYEESLFLSMTWTKVLVDNDDKRLISDIFDGGSRAVGSNSNRVCLSTHSYKGFSFTQRKGSVDLIQPPMCLP